MEISYANYFNTTTQVAVNSNTTTAENLLNRDPFFQYYSDGLNNDATTCSVTITFVNPTVVSRIALLTHNAKEYSFFYNGVTANAFTIENGNTNTSSYSTNSATSQYFRVTAVTITSITFDFKKTMTSNQDKAVGYIFVSDLVLDFPVLPSSRNFKPKINPKQIVHKLSDGGTRLHNVRHKWSCSIDFEHITSTFRNSLQTIWSDGDPFVFCPFGTSTGWDGQFFECVWAGPFEFYEYSQDAATSGFSGTIKLEETPY